VNIDDEDISAQEAAEKERARLSQEDEDTQRQKGSGLPPRKGKSEAHALNRSMKNTIPLNENRMFRRVYARAKSSVTPYFVLYTMKNRAGTNRLGITATKKIGNAVQRNRAKRVIKEAYRLSEEKFPVNLDIVIVARTKAVFCKTQTITAALLPLIEGLSSKIGQG
jgi:ribonuclease P protein component